MNILFVARIISNDAFDILLKKGYKLRSTAQKFHKLILEGFLANCNSITNLSSIPIHKERKIILNNSIDKENLKFKYTYSSKIKVLNDVMVFISAFFISCKWCLNNKKEDCFIFVDNLCVSLSVSAFIAAKIFRVKILTVVTDVPGYTLNNKMSFRAEVAMYIVKKIFSHFDYFILLTEQMNDIVNPKNKPYLIMEGLVDINMEDKLTHKSKNEKIVLYAGGLIIKYGIVDMLNAFMRLEGDNLRLHLYGDGDAVKYIIKCTKKDERIKYFGVCSNDIVVEDQLKSTILINPRPTNEEFTKYSFPSKNMEYMVSGTPVLTTKLPGMPKEYYNHVYLIENESIDGIYVILKEILFKISENDLYEKGISAKEFVIKNKNNIIQSKKIIDLLNAN
ncbi:MAG: glycosyltransferase [Bacteroidales bacterium]